MKLILTNTELVFRGKEKKLYTNVLNPDLCLENKDVAWDTNFSGFNINLLTDEINMCVSAIINVQPGETYITNNGYNHNIWMSKVGSNAASKSLHINEPFVIPAGVDRIRFVFPINNADMTNSKWKNVVMLIKGSELPDEFVPYGSHWV